ncbi:hypothetical protein FGB62_284g00 [Gracilaria domingensis]|nr:hypothetical protein FGB62_284g00 [Gracilaria domingensis]
MSLRNLVFIISMCFCLSHARRQCVAGDQVTVSGRFTCDGIAVPHARMNLVHRIGFMGSFLGRSTTDASGHFKLKGTPIDFPQKDSSSLALHAAYQYVDPEIDKMLLRIHYTDMHDIEGFQTNVKLDNVEMESNHRCKAYLAFYDAVKDYKKRVGDQLPTRIEVHVDERFEGAPFTDYISVISNKGERWDKEKAQHELAHVIRHYFDGDEEHFIEDRDKYQSEDYKDHHCGLKTSDQFAFNEGWAMYWAHQCQEQDHDDRMDVAGNVAQALRDLQLGCATSDAGMVLVLKENKETIHSYTEFEDKHKRLHSCP